MPPQPHYTNPIDKSLKKVFLGRKKTWPTFLWINRMRDISTNSFRLPDHNAMCQLFPKIDLACKVYQQIKAGTEHKAKDKMDVQHVCPNGPGHLHHHRLLASKTTLSCWKKAYTFFSQSDHCSKQTPHCRVSNVCAKISVAGDRCTSGHRG